MEKNMETTTMGFYRVLGIGLRDWGLGFRVGMNEKEHGNYYNGLHRDYFKDPFLHS